MFIRQPAYNWWTSKMGIFEIWDSKIYKICKSIPENVRKEKDSPEKELKHLKTDIKNYKSSQKYLDCKSKLDDIYSRKAYWLRLRSKCDWYKSGEKSNKLFLNLEKTCVS